MTRFRLILATVGLLVVPVDTTHAQQPAPLRTIATFSGDTILGFSVSPSGKFLLVSTKSALRMYDVASSRLWDVARGSTDALQWSPKGDRITWTHGSRLQDFDVWTMQIDALTGRSSGPAQRITTGRSIGGSFSPDGRWIAYVSIDSANARKMSDAFGISIVPATGGPVRVLASRYMTEGPPVWSADGKSLFVNGQADTPAGFGVVRIRVSDGARQLLPTPVGEFLAGTTNGQRLLITSSLGVESIARPGDHASILDSTGRTVGRVPLPAGKLLSLPGSLGDSVLVLHVSAEATGSLEVRPTAGGPAKRLPVVGASNSMPMWSPDGSRIAFFASSAGHAALGVMNADGTNARLYPDTDVLADYLGALWSPDSRSVAFRRTDKPGISILDVASGTTRSVADDPIGAWKWRSDGQALLVRSRRAAKAGIEEILLSGQRRTLLDWPLPGKGLNWAFIGDTSLFQLIDMDTVAYVKSLDSKAARRLSSVTPNSYLLRPTLSANSRQIVMLQSRRNGNTWSTNQLALFTLATGTVRAIDLPFSWQTGASTNSTITYLPGDSAVLVFGKRQNESDVKLFRVPLFGATPSIVAEVGAAGDGLRAASASPDGRSVVYDVRPKGVTHSLVMVDLRSAIPRPSRPAKP